jgi:hypothetical protein
LLQVSFVNSEPGARSWPAPIRRASTIRRNRSRSTSASRRPSSPDSTWWQPLKYFFGFANQILSKFCCNLFLVRLITFTNCFYFLNTVSMKLLLSLWHYKKTSFKILSKLCFVFFQVYLLLDSKNPSWDKRVSSYILQGDYFWVLTINWEVWQLSILHNWTDVSYLKYHFCSIITRLELFPHPNLL